MTLSKESADAFRECLRILAPMYGSHERLVMARNVESYIAQGKWIPAFHLKDIARLFYPKDPKREEVMRLQMLAAIQTKELQSTPNEQDGFLASDLAIWLGCPPVPRDSPLRYWLPEWMQEPAETDTLSAPASTPQTTTNKLRWDDAKLRALYEESILPGVTQISLGEKYGVKRQRIAKLLQDAREKFGSVKSSYSQLMQTGNRTNKGRRYK